MADIQEIISKEAIDGLVKAAQAAQALDSAISNVNKTTSSSAASAKALNDAQKEAERINKEQVKSLNAITKAQEKQIAKDKEYADAIANEAKSIKELQLQNKALIDQRNKLNTSTKEGSKAIKDINAQIDKNNKTIRENSSSLEKQKINIGNYISAWGPFQGIARMVTQGIAIMKIAFMSLKAAIISTGIGALVVAVASLYTYFTRTGEGADKLAVFMAKVRAVVDVLMDRLAKMGQALAEIFTGKFKQGAETMRSAFKGIGDEISREVELAGQLAEKLDAIEDTVRASKVVLAQNNVEREKALAIARSEEFSTKERYSALQRAMGLAKQSFAISKNNAKMELDNLEATAKMRELNDEELNKLADAKVILINQEAEAQSEINSLLKLQNTLTRKIAEENAINATRLLEISKLTAIGTEQVITDAHIEALAMREQADIDFTAREIERLEAVKQAKLQSAQEYVDAAASMGQSLFDFSQMLLDMEVQDMEQAKAYELQMAGDNVTARTAIEKKYEKEARTLKIKQAKQDKALAIFQAIIKTAQAVLAGLAFGPPLGYVFAALNAVLGAVQIGMIASQPIPAFAKGTKSAPKGMALVGEKGRELIFGKDGVSLSPSQATLVNMGRGGQRIIPNRETEMLLRMARGADDGTSRAMMLQMREDNRALIDTIKNKSELHIYGSGRKITERKGNYYKTYYNKKILG